MSELYLHKLLINATMLPTADATVTSFSAVITLYDSSSESLGGHNSPWDFIRKYVNTNDRYPCHVYFDKEEAYHYGSEYYIIPSQMVVRGNQSAGLGFEFLLIPVFDDNAPNTKLIMYNEDGYTYSYSDTVEEV